MAKKMILPLFLLLTVMYLQCMAQKGNIVDMSMDNVDNNTGVAVNCGTADIQLSWTPKDLLPSGEVTIKISYILPHVLDGGSFNASLYFHGDDSPFLGYADKFDCDTLKQYSLPVNCPTKHWQIVHTQKITNLHVLTSYPGYYDAVVQAWNRENEELFCVNITLKVLEVYNGPDEF
ncbi:unnamed protein product [Lymnaea stagnalis]|uniref:MD-2-related lipid-recognition domain-containing protein n=1 Tax=Lymnaea stagnalis TaxID=6523 RepID=A0AAV2HHS9_LYMST